MFSLSKMTLRPRTQSSGAYNYMRNTTAPLSCRNESCNINSSLCSAASCCGSEIKFRRRAKSAPVGYCHVMRGRSYLKPLLGGRLRHRWIRSSLCSARRRTLTLTASTSPNSKSEQLPFGEIEFLRRKLGFTLPTAESVVKSAILKKQPKGKLHKFVQSAYQYQREISVPTTSQPASTIWLPRSTVPSTNQPASTIRLPVSTVSITSQPASSIWLPVSTVPSTNQPASTIWLPVSRSESNGLISQSLSRVYKNHELRYQRCIERSSLRVTSSRQRVSQNIQDFIRSIEVPTHTSEMKTVVLVKPDGRKTFFSKKQLETYEILDENILNSVKKKLESDRKLAREQRSKEKLSLCKRQSKLVPPQKLSLGMSSETSSTDHAAAFVMQGVKLKRKATLRISEDFKLFPSLPTDSKEYKG